MAATGLSRTVQQSFGRGMVRAGSPELIPADGCWDITNGVLDLLGGVYKRGGTSFQTGTAFGGGLRWIWNGFLTAGEQTLVASTTEFGALEAEHITALGHGGMLKPGRPAVYEGKLYLPGGQTYDGTTWGTAKVENEFYAVAGNRLLAAEGSRVLFSKVGDPTTFGETDFWEIPDGVRIIGLEGSRDAAMVFTTRGLWVISGLELELTDAEGNVQQRLDHYSGDLILWGQGGIAAWEGSLIVPTLNGLWLVKRGVTSEQIGSFERISNTIRDLYSEYVESGYEPGQAAVYGNHYFLPIVGAGKVRDVLVCRLDAPLDAQGDRPWTHFSGFGACGSYAVVTAGAGSNLLGATYDASSRVLSTNYLRTVDAGIGTDADGSVAPWMLETRSYQTGNLVPNLVSRLRARYQMAGPEHREQTVERTEHASRVLFDSGAEYDKVASKYASGETTTTIEHFTVGTDPHIRVEVATDAQQPGAALYGQAKYNSGALYTGSGEGRFEALEGEAPADPEASNPYFWKVRRKKRLVRFRISCQDAVVSLSLKTLELFIRPQGGI
jgi:hypothetical protein